MQPCQSQLSQVLEGYLSQNDLSLSSLANQLEVSKSHLSDIKNGKAKAGIDLGLKILKTCGADVAMRRDWLDIYMRNEIPEYQELQQSIVNQWTENKLSKEVGEQFENNLDLMHIALDIIETREIGLAQTDLASRYGEKGRNLADSLVTAGIAKSINSRYYADDKRLILSKKSSYSFVESILRDQRERHLTGSYEGRFEFQVDDVSEGTLQELFTLHQEYMKRLAEVIKKARHSEKPQKGKRVLIQALTCVLRNNLLIFVGVLLSGFAVGLLNGKTAIAADGGLGGGSNASRIQIMRLQGYKGEREAIEAGSQIEALVARSAYEPIQQIGEVQCQSTAGDQAFEKAKVSRYSVERYFSKNQEFYDLNLTLEISCKETKRGGWNGR